MMHLSRFCEDLILWNSAEFNFIQIGDSFTTGSSIMPQKKNPDILELIRGKCSLVYGNLTSILTNLKGLPLSYNRDLQEDKAFIFNSVDFTEDSLALLALVIEGMQPNTEKMRQDCFIGQITATDLADYLVEKNMPFRKAHEVVGKIVAHAETKKMQIFELEISELRKFTKLIEDDVVNYLNPEKTILARKQTGGTAPTQVKREIRVAKNALSKRRS